MEKPEIIFEDKELIVVNKQAGMPSQEDISGDLDVLNFVKRYIKEKYAKEGNVYLGLVHRLDRPVSGLMILARRSKAASRLSTQIRERKIIKKYIAMVEGIPEEKSAKLVNMIRKNKQLNMAELTANNSKDGKEARLKYEVIDTVNGNAIVSIHLETGRFHQIRFQLSKIGHPVVGDKKYGAKPPFSGKIKLHAYSLLFQHPISKETIECLNYPLWYQRD
jgi:23S rRNA pseudouridine1911/1915/1917 synthase